MGITALLKNFLPNKTNKLIPDIPNLLDGVLGDFRGYLPPDTFKLIDEYQNNIESSTHSIKCQLDTEAKKGEKLQCARGNRELDYQKQLQQWKYKTKPQQLKTTSRAVRFNYRNRGIVGKNNLGKTRLNQNQYEENYREQNTKLNPGKSNFQDAFDPDNPDSTIGNRALIFDSNGKVIRTANEINREGRLIDESAKLATKKVRTTAQKNRPISEVKNLQNTLNKIKGAGEISSLAALFTAVTGLVAIACLLAVLVPASFLTVALNWLQTVTTMFTQINNVVTTYLSMTDAGLSLFGYPKSTQKIKDTINGVAYGIFGKDNYEAAKASFGAGILNLTSMTKLLEKVEAAKRSTNGNISELALGLGTVNDALKESGAIPPDSPWSQYSAAADKFVESQSKVEGNEDLKENIQKLTEEIQTQEETQKEIKEENDAKEKIKKKKQKEVDNLKKLGDDVKPILDKQIAEASEYL
jgi:hypothetical protein